jgi:hypothetical protein
MYLSLRKIESTQNTPEIILDPGGLIKISGRSIAISSPQNLASVDEWIDNYVINPAEVTRVDIELEYINKANLKAYSSLMKKISDLKFKNKKFTINWTYEEGDEDIREMGEFFSSSLNIPFSFIMLKEPSMVSFKLLDKEFTEKTFA